MHPAGSPALSGNPQEELVPIAEGAQRLGLAHDSVRKKLAAGTLRGEKREGRWWVWAPTSEPMPDSTRQKPGNDPASSGNVPDAMIDARELINRLEQENAYLRQTLDAEIEARRRADHLVAGLMERLPEIAASAPVDAQDAPRRADPTLRDDLTLQEAYSEPVPTEVSLATAWRRWWRRMTGV